MTATEQNLLAALLDLEDAVARLRTANPKPDLQTYFERIDKLTSQLSPRTNPSLLHYLHKKSYEKARLHLQGHDAENQPGNCRHF